MKIVYSYWSAPFDSRWPYFEKFVDGDKEAAIFNCLLLSVLYAKKWGFRVELVTDLHGEEKLKEVPFDHVSTELELLAGSKKSWVQGKIMAIALQKEPFIHMDWDVLLLKKEIANTLKNFKTDLLVQSVDRKELFGPGYEQQLTELNWHLDHTQFYVNGIHKIYKYGFNCGVMGFNSMKLKDEFVDSFIKCWRITENKMRGDMSLAIEQGLLYAIVEAGPYTFDTIIGNGKRAAEKTGYTHLVYFSKYAESIQTKIKGRIKNEFPKYQYLVEPTPKKLKKVMLSLCTVAMNRLEHVMKTLKNNYELIKPYEGAIDIHFLDYNSVDGLEDYLFAQKWFLDGIKSGIIHFYKNYDATVYHRTLPKNKAHYLAKGQYLVNVDADNYINTGYLEFILNHIRHSRNFFIRPDKAVFSDAYGRILMAKEDFLELEGYNLEFSTYGFEDGEMAARLKLLGKTQVLAPAHLLDDCIRHDDSMRVEDKSKTDNLTLILERSDKKNKQTTIQKYPNKDRTLECKVYKLDKNRTKNKV